MPPDTIPVGDLPTRARCYLRLAMRFAVVWNDASHDARQRVWELAGGDVTGARLVQNSEWCRILLNSALGNLETYADEATKRVA